jgi:uncharacterized protein (TIGR02466 family)
MQDSQNKQTTEIVPIFPTPIYITQLPDSLGSIIPWLTQQPMLDEEVDSPNYGERSKNAYLLDEPEANDLKSHLLHHVREYGTQLGYTYDEYRLGQSWLSYKQPGQHHTMHSHPNSLISGVFYFGEPSEKTPAIKFHKTTVGLNVATMSPSTVSDKRNLPFAQETFSVEFTPGLLVLFPSYLYHSVPKNETDKVRASLAFNTVPKYGLGEEKNLTELKF